MNEKRLGIGSLSIIVDITTHAARVDQTLCLLAIVTALTTTIVITTADEEMVIGSIVEGGSTKRAATKVATIVTVGERLIRIAQSLDVLVTMVTITGVRVILTMSLDKAVADGHPVVFQVLYRLILCSHPATKTTRPLASDHTTGIASTSRTPSISSTTNTGKPGAPKKLQVICILLITKGSFHLARGCLPPQIMAVKTMTAMTFSNTEKKLMRKPSLEKKKKSDRSLCKPSATNTKL